MEIERASQLKVNSYTNLQVFKKLIKILFGNTGVSRTSRVRRRLISGSRINTTSPRVVAAAVPAARLHQHRHVVWQRDLPDVVHVGIQASITQPSVNRRPILSVVSMPSRCIERLAQRALCAAWSSFNVVCTMRSQCYISIYVPIFMLLV